MQAEGLLVKLALKGVQLGKIPGRGDNPITPDEVSAAMARVKSVTLLGQSLLLYLALGDNKTRIDAARQLHHDAESLIDTWDAPDPEKAAADFEALCSLAIEEITSTHLCKKCKGRGRTPTTGGVSVQCSRCFGSGVIPPTSNGLWRQIKGIVSFGRTAWYNTWYDRYMSILDIAYAAQAKGASVLRGALL